MKRNVLWLAFFSGSLLLGGCGGSDSPDVALDPDASVNLPTPPEPEPPAPRLFNNGDLDIEPSLAGEIGVGVYRYTQTSASGDSTVGVGVISRSGRISFALDTRTSLARVELGENGRFNERLLDTDSAIFNQSRGITGARDRINETAETGDRIAGTVVDLETGNLIETYLLEKQAPDDLPLSTAALAASYAGTGDAGITTSITFSDNGTLTGSDTTGCEFDGLFVIPDINEDVIEMRFTAENCGPGTQVSGEARNGTYFALGRADLAAQSVQIFAGNEQVASRYTLQDAATPPSPPAPAGFVNDDFELEQSVVNRLAPGVYAYTDIPLEDPADGDVVEEGLMLVSPTGRVGLLTDRRAIVTRIQVNDLDTFTSEVRQAELIEPEDIPSDAASIFGTPDNPDPGPFQLIGSLLDGEGELVNRYEATRDDVNDVTLAATPLSVAQIAGVYSQTRNPGNITTTLTLATDGTVTGSDTTGCAFNGQAVIPDTSIAVIEMRLNASNCTATVTETGDERDGDYNVVGEILLDGTDRLGLILASDQNIDILTLMRQ